MWSRVLHSNAQIFLAACIVVAVLGQAGCNLSVGQVAPLGWVVSDEPPSAAAFIASQRDHDSVEAARVTSPIFRAELARRGRGTEWPFYGLWIEATSRLDFRFVSAVTDGSGFTFALYAARPRISVGPDSPTSLWRIDLDPEGRVIWGELARIFTSPEVEVVQALGDDIDSATTALPWTASNVDDGQLSVFGVRSKAGDAYLAVGFGQRGTTDDRPSKVTFVMLNASGKVLPNCWSFGQPSPTWDAEWHPADPSAFDIDGLDPADVQTLETYLASIASGPLDG